MYVRVYVSVCMCYVMYVCKYVCFCVYVLCDSMSLICHVMLRFVMPRCVMLVLCFVVTCCVMPRHDKFCAMRAILW